MENKLNLDEIVKIEQMPKVFEQLEKIGSFIDERLDGIEDLECTEENKKEVKERRTEINNTLKILEEKRKEIKNKLNEPYDIFNTKYEETAKKKLENASQVLGAKIETIENSQKKEKEDNVRAYFDEYVVSKNIDFLKFEDIGLNIILSVSDKKLLDDTKAFVDKVSDALELIEMQPYKEEILVEYKDTLNLSDSIKNVTERHKKIELEKEAQEIKKAQLEEENKHIQRIDMIVSPTKVEVPKEEKTEEDILEMTFKVRGSLDKLKELKKYLVDGGYDYDSI